MVATEEVLEEERKRKKKLLRRSLNWKRAERIRQYVQATDVAYKGKKFNTDANDFTDWKKWALAYADELDPLISGKVLK